MLLWNLQPNKKHVNGTKYIVESLTDNFLYLRVVAENCKRNCFTLSRITSDSGDDEFPISGFRRTLFPIRLCSYLIPNGAQGQPCTGALCLDPRRQCFTHGQLHIALSPITHQSNLYIYTERPERLTSNVVFRSVLSR